MRTAILLGLLVLGLFANITPQANAPPTLQSKITEVYTFVAGVPADIAVDVTSNGTVFVNFDSDFYRSDDFGVTWTKVKENADSGSSMYFLRVDSQDRIFAASIDKSGTWIADVWRSHDYGLTWTEVIGNTPRVWRLAEMSNGTLLINTYSTSGSDHIWKSNDGGLTWSVWQNLTAWGNDHIHFVRVNPYNDDIWVGLGDKSNATVPTIARWDNGASSWTFIYNTTTDWMYTDVVFDSTYAYLMPDRSAYRIQRLPHRGTWAEIVEVMNILTDDTTSPTGIPFCMMGAVYGDGLMVVPTDRETVYASVDGIRWLKIFQTTYSGSGAWRLDYISQRRDVNGYWYFVNDYTGKVYRAQLTADDVRQTLNVNAPPMGIEITDFTIQVDEITSPEIKIFNIEAKDNILYLLGGENTGVTKLYVSSDLGSSWTYKYTFTGFAPPSWGHGFYVTKNGTILLYVKNLTDTTYKIFRSGDGGNTFTEVGQDIVADKRFWKATEDLSGNIYIGLYPTYPWVYKSSDNGQTWNLFWNGTSYGERHIHEIKCDPYTGAIWIGTGDSRCLIVNTYNGGVSFNISRAPTVTAFGFTSRNVVIGKDGSRNLIYDKYSDNWSDWFTREYDYLSHIWGMASYQDKVYSVSSTSPDGGLPATYVWYNGNSVRLFRATEESAVYAGFIKITSEPIYSKWFVLWVDKKSNMKVLRFGDLNTEEILYLNYKQSPIFYSESSSYDTLTRRIVLLADEETTVSFADSYITNAEIRLLPYRIVENSSMIRYTWDFEDGNIPSGFTIGSGVTGGVVSQNPYNGTKSLSLNYSGTTLKWSNTGARVINWTNGGVPIGYVTFLVMHHTQDIKAHAPDFSTQARITAEFTNTNGTKTAFYKRGTMTGLNRTNNWNVFAFFNSTNNNRLWKAQIVWRHDTTFNTWSDSIQFYVVNSSMFWKIAHNPPFIHNINETPNKVYINDTLYTVNGWASLSALGEVKTLKLKLKSGGMGAAIAEIRGTMKFKSNIPFSKGTNVYYAKRGSSLASITNYNTGILTVYSVTNESSITSATYIGNTLSFTISTLSGITSTTKVYCSIRGEPTAIYTTNGTLTWSYNTSTTILTLNATHASPTKILIYWKFPGDIDGDGDVDWFDFGDFAQAYGSSVGDTNYNVQCDFNLDGDVDWFDFGIFAGNYGKTA